MASYYVDFNRGADGNNGTSSATPWKNLSKIIGTGSLAAAAGDTIYLAADSEWILGASGLGIPGNGSGWRGSAGNPVTLTRYDPTGTTPSNVLPIIEYNFLLSTLTWSWDATNLCWKATGGNLPAGTTKQSIIRLDSSTWGIIVPSAAAVKLATGAFYIDAANPANIYMNSGSTVSNPGVVWSAGWICPDVRSGIWIYDSGAGAPAGQYLTIDSIKYRNTLGIKVQITPALAASTGLIVQNCRVYRGRLLAHTRTSGGTSTITVKNNILEDVVPTMGIWLYGPHTSEISGNTIYGANAPAGKTQGAIYIQAWAGTTYIRANTIHGALRERGPSGSGLGFVDGCGIYLEDGSANCVVEGNTVYNSCCAFQDNSGQVQVWRNNTTYRCNIGLFIDDFSANGSMNTTVEGNRFLDCLPKSSFADATSGDWITHVIYGYKDGVNTIKNNQITFANQVSQTAVSADRRAIWIEPTTGTNARVIQNNTIGTGGATNQPAAGTYDASNAVYVKTVGTGGSVTGNIMLGSPRHGAGVG